MWRYTGLTDLWKLAKACFLSSLLILAIILYAERFEGYSRAVFVADGIITLLLAGGLRLAIRLAFSFRHRHDFAAESGAIIKRKKCLIIGAGDAGEQILREIIGNKKLHYEVIGFVDDDPAKRGRAIHNVPILGSVSEIPYIVNKKSVEEMLIAIPSASGEQIRRIIEVCAGCDLPYKTLPSLGELIDGRASVKVLRDIDYEDLLGRSVIRLNIEDIRSYIENKAVLITGCGGSIGSELCRQVIKYNPRFLALLAASEANLFYIHNAIKDEKLFKYCIPILGQVQNEELMDDILSKYRPEVVFHAAAYKHVPMLEVNPWEAVFNNIVGSRVAMEMSVKNGVKIFVLVSTDKAVHPTSVMGASKRLSELIMQSLKANSTRFMAVRFGNVVGSSGSVVPLFRRQIEHGGPVTVTHPEVTRYFMTIPEAAQLILQAGAIGSGGEIFLLRMGRPVKITDMARDLIRLSGKKPDVDIKIVYTGLREGEKLQEELILEGEGIEKTSHEKLMVLRSNHLSNDGNKSVINADIFNKQIGSLIEASAQHNAQAIKALFQKIVPEYKPYNGAAVL